MLTLKIMEFIKTFIFSNKCCICNKTLNNNIPYICPNCKKKIVKKVHLRKFNKIYFILDYDIEIKNLIKNFKFYNKKYIGYFLCELTRDSLYKIILENKINLVIPVPISKEKKLKRGFNQIDFILELLGINYIKIIRNKDTYPMSMLKNIYARHLNIKSSFSIPFSTLNKNILIVDDILTTGSTVKEMIKEINEKGTPNSIFIFSIATANSFYRNVSSILV